jgi:hypothetical protein
MASYDQRRAAAYAKHFKDLFIARYIRAARVGRADVIPVQWRQHVLDYVNNTRLATPIDFDAEVEAFLYGFTMANGYDPDLPPDFQSAPAAPSAPRTVQPAKTDTPGGSNLPPLSENGAFKAVMVMVVLAFTMGAIIMLMYR